MEWQGFCVGGRQNFFCNRHTHTSEELNAFIEEHYAASKEDNPADFPISYRLLQSEQQKDCEVKKLLKNHPDDYKQVSRKHGNHNYELVVDKEGHIYAPKQLQKCTATWYHEMLMHPGETGRSSQTPIIIHGRACAKQSSMYVRDATHANTTNSNIPNWERSSTPRIPR
jgi:hypothetical protein